MILVQIQDVSRYFGATCLYEDVSFSIQDNDRIALVGRNGAGKSTLIRQIMQKEPINNGQITYAKDITIGYLDQHVNVDSKLTIWEEMLNQFSSTLKLRDSAQAAAEEIANLAANGLDNTDEYRDALNRYDSLNEEVNRLNAYSIESDIRQVLHGFRFYEEDYDKPVESLSGGQKTRLALAQLLLKKHDLLILDEPTNHLDLDMLAWLENYLNKYRGALLVVSHDRYFLDRITNKVVEIRNNTSHLYKGNYSYYVEEKALRLEQELKAYTSQQEKIAELEEFVNRNIARASTSGMAKSRRKQLERIDRLEKPKQDPRAPRIQFSAEKESGERVIEASNLTIGYKSNEGSTPIAGPINFDLRKQDAIAVVGPNGVGKTTLLRTIVKQLPALEGEVIYGTNVYIGYYDQNVNHLDPKKTVLETLWQYHTNANEGDIRSILGSFLFSGETVEKTVGMLSGGEKARLALAVLASQHDNTLLLDEPTNHLDIDSKEVLENSLIEYNGTILFVSHDRYFINRIATAVLEISEDGSKLYLGDYDYYLTKKTEQEEILAQKEAAVEKEEVKKQTAGQLDYKKRQELQKEQRRLERAISACEEKLKELEEKAETFQEEMLVLAQENKAGELAKIHEDSQANQEEIDKTMQAWEEYALELEAFLEENPDL